MTNNKAMVEQIHENENLVENVLSKEMTLEKFLPL